MKTNHKNSNLIDIGQGEAGIPTSLQEFHRDINGMHQEIEPRETETAFWEEIDVLRDRKGGTSLTARN